MRGLLHGERGDYYMDKEVITTWTSESLLHGQRDNYYMDKEVITTWTKRSLPHAQMVLEVLVLVIFNPKTIRFHKSGGESHLKVSYLKFSWKVTQHSRRNTTPPILSLSSPISLRTS